MFKRAFTSLTIPLLVSALMLSPLALSVQASASERSPPTFAEIVRNTKESESRILKSEFVSEAEYYFPIGDPTFIPRLTAAFTALARSLEPKGDERATEFCEPLVLSRLQAALQSQNLSAGPMATRFALLLIREQNLIDDLTLMPLLAAHPAWLRLGYRESDWTRRDPEGRTAQLQCPTDQYLPIVAAVRHAKGRKMKRRDIRRAIETLEQERNDRDEPRSLPMQIAWLQALRKATYDKHTRFSLTTVLGTVAETKNISPRADPSEKPSPVLSKKRKNSGGISNRMALYAKYDGQQIWMLVERYRIFTERSDVLGAQAQIVIHYQDGRPDEVYKLDPQEQYRMAVKMLHKEIEELRLSGLFNGKAVSFDDVIIAALETGFIRSGEVDAALAVDDLWNPNVSGWTKMMNILKRYGGTALALVPNPYTFWASLAITLSEALVTKSSEGAGKPDDHGTSIF